MRGIERVLTALASKAPAGFSYTATGRKERVLEVLRAIAPAGFNYTQTNWNDRVLEALKAIAPANFNYPQTNWESRVLAAGVAITGVTLTQKNFCDRVDQIINAYNPATLVLDNISGVEYAYSLRKLRTAYTGAAIRVRRSSDNTETDIGFIGQDLDTAALLSFAGAGNAFVTTFYNQGTVSGGNLSNGTTANQPRIVASGALEVLPGTTRPALRFDGVTAFSVSNASLGTTLFNWQSGSAYSVAYGSTLNRTIWSSGTSFPAFQLVSTGAMSYFVSSTGDNAGRVISSATSYLDTKLVIGASHNYSQSRMDINVNSALTTSNTYTITGSNSSAFRIGLTSSSTNRWNGFISEAFFSNADTINNAVIANMSNYWN